MNLRAGWRHCNDARRALAKKRYQDVMDFMEKNHRNPSRHRLEEHVLLNWLKANRKLMNAGKLKEEREERFRELMEMGEKYKRVNQYVLMCNGGTFFE